VGSYRPNRYGVHDLRGNVMEWCRDWFDQGYYRRSPRANPTGPERGALKVARGNSWHHGAGRPGQRYFQPPSERLVYLGFRCVRSAPGGRP
jgi:formylglycine-generating enzyme required for sulfatase activity